MSSNLRSANSARNGRIACRNPHCRNPGMLYTNFGLFQHLDLTPICRSHYTQPVHRHVPNQSPSNSTANVNMNFPALSNELVLPALDGSIVDTGSLGEDDHDVPLPPQGSDKDDDEVSLVDLLDASSSGSVDNEESDFSDSSTSVHADDENMPVVECENVKEADLNSDLGDELSVVSSSDSDSDVLMDDMPNGASRINQKSDTDSNDGSMKSHLLQPNNDDSSPFFDPSMNDGMPPKVYDYSEHQDGCYTPRRWIQQWIDWSQSTYATQLLDHPDEAMLPDNLDLLNLFLSDPNYQYSWPFISQSEKAEISLMNTLNNIKGCPLYVYDAVLLWTKSMFGSVPQSLDDDDSPIPLLRTREKFVKDATKFAHTTGMTPTTRQVYLPGCRKTVPLTTMSYTANLYHFLTNRDLVNDDTLIIPGNTPHDLPPDHPPLYYDDVDSGSRYRDSYVSMKNDVIDLPAGDVLFVDKSHVDANGRLCAEPVNHTFTLVNRSTRYNPNAWYSMGCIPNQRGLSYEKSAKKKVQDYHLLLGIILEEYRGLQTRYKGLLWPLLFKGKLYMVRLRPYVYACLGDTPGQNYMCAKMGSNACNRICRQCEIEKKHLGHPWISAPPITKERVHTIQNTKDLPSAYSYHVVDRCWDRLNFGSPNESIDTNVPCELLHVFQKGILVYVLDVLLTSKSCSVATRNEEHARLLRIEAKEKGALTEEQVRAELISDGVFGGQFTLRVDNLSRDLGKLITTQSDRNLPRTHFTQGIVNHCKTTASEQQGILLLFNIILCSTWAIDKDEGVSFRLGLKKHGEFIQIIERLLCLEELLKCHSLKSEEIITRENLPYVFYYVQVVLSTIRANADREAGDGFNVVKFHLLNHMFRDDVPKYGSPANVSGGPGESQFKVNMKNPALKTQMNDVTFLEQMCIKHMQNITARRCAQRVSRQEDYQIGAFAGRPYLLNPLHEGPLRRPDSFLPKSTGKDHSFGSVLRKTDVYFDHVKKAKEREKDVDTETPLEVPDGEPVGLSGFQYVYFLPRRSITCTEQNGAQIAFVGKKNSSRYRVFTRNKSPTGAIRILLDINNKPVGTKGCIDLRSFNDGFNTIAGCIEESFGRGRYTRRIPIFTVYRVKPTKYQEVNTLYRADPCFHLGFKERNDWALFGTRLGNRVGQIMCFIKMDAETIAHYNAHKPAMMGTITDPPGDYALAQLFQREVPGLIDPTFHRHKKANVMNVNSVLLFFGEKQQREGQPVTRILPVSQIMRPLVVLPDVHPVFSSAASGCAIINLNKNETRKHAFMVLRPRDLWHKVFLSQARAYYLKDGGHEGVARQRERQEKKARADAKKEHEAAQEKAEEKKKLAKAKRLAKAAVAEDSNKKTKSVPANKQAVSSIKPSISGKRKAIAGRK